MNLLKAESEFNEAMLNTPITQRLAIQGYIDQIYNELDFKVRHNKGKARLAGQMIAAGLLIKIHNLLDQFPVE